LPAPVTILPAATKVPAPEYLCATGRRHWDRVWKAAGLWLSESDIGALERYCQLADWRDVMLETVVEEGFTVRGSTGQPTAHPLLARVEAANSEMRALEATLGLTPVSRAQLGVAEVQRQSKLTEMMRRQRER
jgi:P27 family predicted phage terminase small subunit